MSTDVEPTTLGSTAPCPDSQGEDKKDLSACQICCDRDSYRPLVGGRRHSLQEAHGCSSLTRVSEDKSLLSLTTGSSKRCRAAVPYSRNTWYYHLDNAKEDAVENFNCHNSTTTTTTGTTDKPGGILPHETVKQLPQEVRNKRAKAPYKRNDWFYYLDYAAEDAEKKDANRRARTNPPESQPTGDTQPTRDSQAIGDSQANGDSQPVGAESYHTGGNVNNSERGSTENEEKKVKFPEIYLPCLGTRKEKPQFSNPWLKKKMVVGKQQGTLGVNPKVYGALASEDQGVNMRELLAGSYGEEWKDQIRNYHLQEKQKTPARKPGHVATEYKTAFGPALHANRKQELKWASVPSRFRDPSTRHSAKVTQPRKPSEAKESGLPLEEKAAKRFVLSKFKKVGPKISTGQKLKKTTAPGS